MKHRNKRQEPEQLQGDEAGLVNAARGQLKSYIDKMAALIEEGRDMLVDLDTRLRDFDATSRRVEPTTEQQENAADRRY